ncbi:hypothetical protein EI94DRAFT_274420 [Lactarius quietus]|nr:hypothetical protein EI94DRAFT_274420 [Lactarius quietus]
MFSPDPGSSVLICRGVIENPRDDLLSSDTFIFDFMVPCSSSGVIVPTLLCSLRCELVPEDGIFLCSDYTVTAKLQRACDADFINPETPGKLVVSGVVLSTDDGADAFTVFPEQTLSGISAITSLRTKAIVAFPETADLPYQVLPDLNSFVSFSGDILTYDHADLVVAVHDQSSCCFRSSNDVHVSNVPSGLARFCPGN